MKYIPRALRYLLPYWKLGVVSGALILLSTLFGLLAPWPLKFLVDNVLQKEPLPPVLADLLGDDRMAWLFIAVGAGLAFTFIQHGLDRKSVV